MYFIYRHVNLILNLKPEFMSFCHSQKDSLTLIFMILRISSGLQSSSNGLSNYLLLILMQNIYNISLNPVKNRHFFQIHSYKKWPYSIVAHILFMNKVVE